MLDTVGARHGHHERSGHGLLGATAATTAGNELAHRLYVDSGFGDYPHGGLGLRRTSNVSNASDMELLTEDQVLPYRGGDAERAAVDTGPARSVGMATFGPQGQAPPLRPRRPAAPTG